MPMLGRNSTSSAISHCWLSTYVNVFRFRNNDLCVCGEGESDTHVLLDARSQESYEQELREKVGDAFNSMSTLLRGPGEEGRSKANNTPRKKTVEVVLDFTRSIPPVSKPQAMRITWRHCQVITALRLVERIRNVKVKSKEKSLIAFLRLTQETREYGCSVAISKERDSRVEPRERWAQ